MNAEKVVSEWPDFLLELLADDIRSASEINPRSWAIHSYRDFQFTRPALSVSMYTVLSFNDSNQVTFAMDRDQLSEDTIGRIKSISTPRTLREPWIFSVSLPVTFIKEHYEELADSHRALVGRLAKYSAQRRNEHRQDFLEAFNRKLGESLPNPAYLAEINQSKRENGFTTNGPGPTRVKPDTEFIGDISGISASFAANGLHYTDLQIADFYTALQTKGFVVLSGISGTGKSKIATGFTELLARNQTSGIESTLIDDYEIIIPLKSYSLPANSLVIPKKFQHHFPIVPRTGSIPVQIEFDGQLFQGSLSHNPSLEIHWRKDLREFVRDHEVGDLVRLTPNWKSSSAEQLRSISMQFVNAKNETPQGAERTSNTLFLSVRPDWRDSTSLLGYYNPLTKTYEWTDFLRFILDAAENYRSDDPIAWFVILDEMNLAHVEYYFADLLSVLESGRNTNPDSLDYGFTNQPLRLTYPDIVVNEAPPTEVRLPPNLYIIGTVNMDETTHAFSPKVLDRAFTMELTDVDFTDYPRSTPINQAGMLNEAEKQTFLQVFTQNGRFPQIRKDEIRDFVLANEDIRLSIQRLNENLAKYRFHFGYRVFDEIMQFLANADSNEMYEAMTDPNAALDSAAFMKILPKFSGSEARVGPPLAALIEWAKDPFALGEAALPLTRTLERASYMQGVLQSDGFVTAF